MKRIPLFDASAPIACTITAAAIPGRIELVERMRSNLLALERTDHGVVLRFPKAPEVEADVRRFAIDEKRCCEFWGFEVVVGDDGALRWDAPPSAADLIERLVVFFEGDEPASELAALL